MVALSRNIPRKQAFEMLTTGEFIEADRAVSLGLINRSVSHNDLATETQALAEQIGAKLAVAVKIGKEAFYKQLQMPIADAYSYTGNVMVENMLELETKEGINAFIDKRPPDWSQWNNTTEGLSKMLEKYHNTLIVITIIEGLKTQRRTDHGY